MDYTICLDPRELESTDWVEIGPGRYDGKYWQEGFLFVRGDAFVMAEGLLTRHFIEYDPLGPNEIPRSVGLDIITGWRDAADVIEGARPGDGHMYLNLPAYCREELVEEVARHRDEIVQMLRGLAAACETFYERSDHIVVVGP